jgi:hypothetical protein
VLSAVRLIHVPVCLVWHPRWQGPITCGGFAASCQHETLDAVTFAEWGIDYVSALAAQHLLPSSLSASSRCP